MKKSTALLFTLVFVFVLSACNKAEVMTPPDSAIQTQENTTDKAKKQPDTISREQAIEIALAHAKLNKADVYDLDAEFDREYNGKYWEVDFDHGGYEYSYDIDVNTGEIVRDKKQRD